jgi:hypothetical protein
VRAPIVIFLLLCATAAPVEAAKSLDWRRKALETMRAASASRLISDPVQLERYRAAGFNTLVVFDAEGLDEAGTAWDLKPEKRIAMETAFARQVSMPLVVGLAVEPFVAAHANALSFARGPRDATLRTSAHGLIPAATDDAIRERIRLWMKHGSDVVLGVFPWYDDVFWQTVTVERQRHVYSLIKETAPDLYMFGMIGEFGFNASDEEIAHYFDAAAFDHLIVLMNPYNVGSMVTGFPLDHTASSDPDGDLVRYVDRFVDRMADRFFRRLTGGQLILIVSQAFHYPGEPEGRIPRGADVEVMSRRAASQLRALAGQEQNFSAAFCDWGSESLVGLSQRPDWRDAAAVAIDELERRGRPDIRF